MKLPVLTKEVIAEIPNWLTFLRLGLIPLFVLLMIDPTPFLVNLALFVFICAALTDYVDGYWARHFGVVSDFGKLLDPLADKILVMSALVMLVSQRSDLYGEPWVPGWMVVLILAREIWVTGIRGLAASRGLMIASGNSGKFKSTLQMIAIICLLLHEATFRFGPWRMTFQAVGINLLLLSIVLSYWGAVDYSMMVFKGDSGAAPSADSTKN